MGKWPSLASSVGFGVYEGEKGGETIDDGPATHLPPFRWKALMTWGLLSQSPGTACLEGSSPTWISQLIFGVLGQYLCRFPEEEPIP